MGGPCVQGLTVLLHLTRAHKSGCHAGSSAPLGDGNPSTPSPGLASPHALRETESCLSHTVIRHPQTTDQWGTGCNTQSSPRAGDADHSYHVKGRLPEGARPGLQTELKAGELRPPTKSALAMHKGTLVGFVGYWRQSKGDSTSRAERFWLNINTS